MAEVSDNDLRVLRGAHALLDQLMKNKDTRRDVEKSIKKLHPTVQTTDDLAEPYVSKLEGVEKKIDEFIQSQKDRELDGKLNGSFKQLRDAGYTDEGIEKIKKLMVDEQIANPEAAAAFWEKKNPPKVQEPSLFAPHDWQINTGDDNDTKLLFKDEDAWANREIQKVFSEIKAGKLDE